MAVADVAPSAQDSRAGLLGRQDGALACGVGGVLGVLGVDVLRLGMTGNAQGIKVRHAGAPKVLVAQAVVAGLLQCVLQVADVRRGVGGQQLHLSAPAVTADVEPVVGVGCSGERRQRREGALHRSQASGGVQARARVGARQWRRERRRCGAHAEAAHPQARVQVALAGGTAVARRREGGVVAAGVGRVAQAAAERRAVQRAVLLTRHVARRIGCCRCQASGCGGCEADGWRRGQRRLRGLIARRAHAEAAHPQARVQVTLAGGTAVARRREGGVAARVGRVAQAAAKRRAVQLAVLLTRHVVHHSGSGWRSQRRRAQPHGVVEAAVVAGVVVLGVGVGPLGVVELLQHVQRAVGRPAVGGAHAVDDLLDGEVAQDVGAGARAQHGVLVPPGVAVAVGVGGHPLHQRDALRVAQADEGPGLATGARAPHERRQRRLAVRARARRRGGGRRRVDDAVQDGVQLGAPLDGVRRHDGAHLGDGLCMSQAVLLQVHDGVAVGPVQHQRVAGGVLRADDGQLVLQVVDLLLQVVAHAVVARERGVGHQRPAVAVLGARQLLDQLLLAALAVVGVGVVGAAVGGAVVRGRGRRRRDLEKRGVVAEAEAPGARVDEEAGRRLADVAARGLAALAHVTARLVAARGARTPGRTVGQPDGRELGVVRVDVPARHDLHWRLGLHVRALLSVAELAALAAADGLALVLVRDCGLGLGLWLGGRVVARLGQLAALGRRVHHVVVELAPLAARVAALGRRIPLTQLVHLVQLNAHAVRVALVRAVAGLVGDGHGRAALVLDLALHRLHGQRDLEVVVAADAVEGVHHVPAQRAAGTVARTAAAWLGGDDVGEGVAHGGLAHGAAVLGARACSLAALHGGGGAGVGGQAGVLRGANRCMAVGAHGGVVLGGRGREGDEGLGHGDVDHDHGDVVRGAGVEGAQRRRQAHAAQLVCCGLRVAHKVRAGDDGAGVLVLHRVPEAV